MGDPSLQPQGLFGPTAVNNDLPQAAVNPDEARARAFLGQPSLFSGLLGPGGVDQQKLAQQLSDLKIDPRQITAKPGDPNFMEQLGKALKPYEDQLRAELGAPKTATLADMRGALSQKLGADSVTGAAGLDSLSLPELMQRAKPAPVGRRDEMDRQGPPPEAPQAPERPQARPQAPREPHRAGVSTARAPHHVSRPPAPPPLLPDDPVESTGEPPARAIPPTPPAPQPATPPAPPPASKYPTSTELNAAVKTLWYAEDFTPPKHDAPAATDQQLAADPNLKAWTTLHRAAPNQIAHLRSTSAEAEAFYQRMFPPETPAEPLAPTK